MKLIRLMLFAMLLLLFACGNDDDSDNSPMFNNMQEFQDYVASRDWMFGVEIDNKTPDTAELYIVESQVELSMDDVIILTINGASVGTELIDDEGDVWLDFDSVEIPSNRKLDVVFKYNGNTIIDSTIRIPLAPSITGVDITTPNDPIQINWEAAISSTFQLVEVWISDSQTGYKDYVLSGSARSLTIAADTFALVAFEHWAMELFEVNLVQYKDNAIMAFSYDLESSDSRDNNRAGIWESLRKK